MPGMLYIVTTLYLGAATISGIIALLALRRDGERGANVGPIDGLVVVLWAALSLAPIRWLMHKP